MNGRRTDQKRRLAVIPSDPLQAYIDKGTSTWLQEYYNPEHVFDEVYLLSPRETSPGHIFGMQVIPTKPEEFSGRLEHLQIDVVRAYGGYWPCDLATSTKVRGIPVVVSVHDTNPSLLHDSIRTADHVLVVSEAVGQLVKGRGVPEHRITLFGNRVNLKTFVPRRDPETRRAFKKRFPGKYHILHVGRRTPQKNLDTLLRALPLLGEDYALLCIGRGERVLYREMARELHVEHRCEFFDCIPNEDLPFFYSNCDVMCTPSRYEGFGLVFVEALACEAVVVTSDIAPLNTLIRHGSTGILVKEYEDPAALAQAIRTATTDEVLRARITSSARDSVRRFSKERVDAFEAAFYRWVIGGCPDGERPQFSGTDMRVGSQQCTMVEAKPSTGANGKPEVSIVLPTYNQEAYLPRAVQSILCQTYRDFELIIVNDGSSDGTRQYLERLRDPRIRIIHQENQRLPRALNAGFGAARGDLLTWISSDNYCAPVFLEELAGALKANPDAGFAFSAFAWIDDRDQLLSVERPARLCYRTLLLEKDFGVASFMYRRECQDAVGLYDTSLEGAEDLDMWLRMTERFPVVYLPDVLSFYRLHDRSMTSVMKAEVTEARGRLVRRIFASWDINPGLDVLYPGIPFCRDRMEARRDALADLGTLVLREPHAPAESACRLLADAAVARSGDIRLKGNLALALARAKRWDEAKMLLRELDQSPDRSVRRLSADLSAAFGTQDTRGLASMEPLNLRSPIPEVLVREEKAITVWLGNDTEAVGSNEDPGVMLDERGTLQSTRNWSPAVTALVSAAREMIERGALQEAVAQLSVALRALPADCRLLLEYGECQQHRGDLQAAHDAFSTAVLLNPDLPLAHARLAGVLVQMEQFAAAESAARAACQLRPCDIESRRLCLTLLGHLCIHNNRAADAITVFSDALQLCPLDNDVLFGLGLSYEAKGEFHGAYSVFQRVLSADPDNTSARYELGVLEERFRTAAAKGEGHGSDH